MTKLKKHNESRTRRPKIKPRGKIQSTFELVSGFTISMALIITFASTGAFAWDVVFETNYTQKLRYIGIKTKHATTSLLDVNVAHASTHLTDAFHNVHQLDELREKASLSRAREILKRKQIEAAQKQSRLNRLRVELNLPNLAAVSPYCRPYKNRYGELVVEPIRSGIGSNLPSIQGVKYKEYMWDANGKKSSSKHKFYRFNAKEAAKEYKTTRFALVSFYGDGDGFAGKHTASGEIFDVNALTMAHVDLPIQSCVMIQAESGRIVIVRVNDAGPFHKDHPGKFPEVKGINRSGDLSPMSAKMLGTYELGVARVLLTYLPEQKKT